MPQRRSGPRRARWRYSCGSWRCSCCSLSPWRHRRWCAWTGRRYRSAPTGRRTRLAHSVVKARRVGKSEILNWEALRPTPEIAGMLELSARARTLAVNSLDVVDGKVIGVCTQYFPLPRFEGFGEAYAKAGKTHLALAQFGVQQFQRRLSRITARLPSLEIAQRLGQPVSQPILYVETVYVDQDDKPFEYGISNFSSTAVQLVIEPD
nr:UTRA domain-containing protein [Massilia sp. YIM B04103]